MKKLCKYGISTFCFWLFWVYSRAKVTPFKPYTQPGVIVAPHQHFFDLVWIPFALKKMLPAGKKCYFVVHQHNFQSPLWRFLTWYFDVIELVERQDFFTKSTKTIANGDFVFLFPEGTFNTNPDQFLPFYHGASNLAAKCQCPIYPIAIHAPKLFGPWPFPANAVDQLKSLWHFRFAQIRISQTPTVPAPKDQEFDTIVKTTEKTQDALATKTSQKKHTHSPLVQKCKNNKNKITPELQKMLQAKGVQVPLGIFFHWRSLVILEYTWKFHQSKPLNITIGPHSAIMDKVYLTPNTKIDRKCENEVV